MDTDKLTDERGLIDLIPMPITASLDQRGYIDVARPLADREGAHYKIGVRSEILAWAKLRTKPGESNG